jgi:tetratricopeptide (TPR) repeat protein
MEIDPENIDVPQLKLEIDAFKKAEEEKKLEAQRKKAERKRMVDALAPGKGLYLKQDWFKAVDRLEKFLNMKGMDEDLVKDATRMLKDSRRKLSALVNPLLGKARSFKEGQDFKRAYETYGEVLKYDPINEEALNERQIIMETLTLRSRRLYREALISESLSLFQEAKEKFQQVQQISPINSEYYNKATDKLKNYLE